MPATLELSTSYWLLQKGLSHVVLERGEIGEAWRSRWDSFQLNTPNKFTYLPGMKYDGPDHAADRDDASLSRSS